MDKNIELLKGVSIPKVLPVHDAVICIDVPRARDFVSFNLFEQYQFQLTRILSLLSSFEKESAENDELGFYLTTNNLSAIRYASDNSFLSDHHTKVAVLCKHLEDKGEEITEEVFEAIDLVDASIEQLSDEKFYLVIK